MTILYNPKCGTCRKVKEAVEAKGFKPTLVEYLKTPPTVAELDRICQKLGLEPQDVARTKEPVYEAVAARCQTRQDWLQALHDHPVLIQRPIVVLDDPRLPAGRQAIIARPPEVLNTFL